MMKIYRAATPEGGSNLNVLKFSQVMLENGLTLRKPSTHISPHLPHISPTSPDISHINVLKFSQAPHLPHISPISPPYHLISLYLPHQRAQASAGPIAP